MINHLDSFPRTLLSRISRIWPIKRIPRWISGWIFARRRPCRATWRITFDNWHRDSLRTQSCNVRNQDLVEAYDVPLISHGSSKNQLVFSFKQLALFRVVSEASCFDSALAYLMSKERVLVLRLRRIDRRKWSTDWVFFPFKYRSIKRRFDRVRWTIFKWFHYFSIKFLLSSYWVSSLFWRGTRQLCSERLKKRNEILKRRRSVVNVSLRSFLYFSATNVPVS